MPLTVHTCPALEGELTLKVVTEIEEGQPITTLDELAAVAKANQEDEE